MEMEELSYKLEGNANDCLYESEDNKVKTIRLICDQGASNYSFEIISESESGNEYTIVDALKNHRISIEVKIID